MDDKIRMAIREGKAQADKLGPLYCSPDLMSTMRSLEAFFILEDTLTFHAWPSVDIAHAINLAERQNATLHGLLQDVRHDVKNGNWVQAAKGMTEAYYRGRKSQDGHR